MRLGSEGRVEDQPEASGKGTVGISGFPGRAVSRLHDLHCQPLTAFLAGAGRRHECRHGTHQCVRYGCTTKTVPYLPCPPAAVVVPNRVPFGPKVTPASGKAPSLAAWNACSTFSVHAAPEVVGGVNENTAP